MAALTNKELIYSYSFRLLSVQNSWLNSHPPDLHPSVQYLQKHLTTFTQCSGRREVEPNLLIQHLHKLPEIVVEYQSARRPAVALIKRHRCASMPCREINANCVY